jgi:hypothetical protein
LADDPRCGTGGCQWGQTPACFSVRPATFCAIGTEKDARLEPGANQGAADRSESWKTLGKLLNLQISEMKTSEIKILETKA